MKIKNQTKFQSLLISTVYSPARLAFPWTPSEGSRSISPRICHFWRENQSTEKFKQTNSYSHLAIFAFSLRSHRQTEMEDSDWLNGCSSIHSQNNVSGNVLSAAFRAHRMIIFSVWRCCSMMTPHFFFTLMITATSWMDAWVSRVFFAGQFLSVLWQFSFEFTRREYIFMDSCGRLGPSFQRLGR